MNKINSFLAILDLISQLKISIILIKEIKEQVKSSINHYHLKGLLNKLIMEVFNMSNWMIKAGHYDKLIKNLATLETLNFYKYREDRLEFNVIEYGKKKRAY